MFCFVQIKISCPPPPAPRTSSDQPTGLAVSSVIGLTFVRGIGGTAEDFDDGRQQEQQQGQTGKRHVIMVTVQLTHNVDCAPFRAVQLPVDDNSDGALLGWFAMHGTKSSSAQTTALQKTLRLHVNNDHTRTGSTKSAMTLLT